MRLLRTQLQSTTSILLRNVEKCGEKGLARARVRGWRGASGGMPLELAALRAGGCPETLGATFCG